MCVSANEHQTRCKLIKVEVRSRLKEPKENGPCVEKRNLLFTLKGSSFIRVSLTAGLPCSISSEKTAGGVVLETQQQLFTHSNTARKSLPTCSGAFNGGVCLTALH